jgi:hypothetical protein
MKKNRVLKKRVAWEGDMPVLNLRKLSMEERKKRYPHSVVSVPGEKQPRYIAETQKEIHETRP